MPTQVSSKTDKYLDTPRAFHLEMPLYHEIETKLASIEQKVYALLAYGGTIDIYCTGCAKESIFDTSDHERDPFDRWKLYKEGIHRSSFICNRDRNHQYCAYFLITADAIQKIGQFPSVADFQIPQAEKYRKILGEEQYKELTRGIGLAAHGVGIGSFVYPRRIFSNLIEEEHSKSKAEPNFPEEEYKNARMDKKIKILEDKLPKFLVDNRALYSILSKGLHELSEEECLKYFDTIRIGIEQILDEKIEQQEKAKKAEAARLAIQGVSQKIAGSS